MQKRLISLLSQVLTHSFLFSSNMQPQSHSQQSFDRTKYIQETQSAEIGMLKEQAQNLEISIEAIRKELSSLVTATKEYSKKSNGDFEKRLSKMEENFEKALADMKTIKSRMNDTSDLFAETQKKLHDLYEMCKLQNEEIHELEGVMNSFAKIMQVKNALSTDEKYKVESGDSLEKIAKKYGTTVQALKEINELKKNVIIPGQMLKIPK